ncbi:MAG: hypothetical protein ABJC89_14470 [Acidobacteriota bacterium]
MLNGSGVTWEARATPVAVRRCSVLDLLLVGVGALFFVVSIGYVAACDRLMK